MSRTSPGAFGASAGGLPPEAADAGRALVEEELEGGPPPEAAVADAVDRPVPALADLRLDREPPLGQGREGRVLGEGRREEVAGSPPLVALRVRRPGGHAASGSAGGARGHASRERESDSR